MCYTPTASMRPLEYQTSHRLMNHHGLLTSRLVTVPPNREFLGSRGHTAPRWTWPLGACLLLKAHRIADTKHYGPTGTRHFVYIMSASFHGI
jgi:hypothetical protein